MTWYVVDGTDGSGKSSIAEMLKDELESSGRKVEMYVHPDRDTVLGRMEARLLTIPGKAAKITSAVFYLADELRSLIRMRLREERCDDVIFVRYIMGVAYLGERFAPTGYRFFEKVFPPMEVCILVKTDPDIALERIRSRGEEIEVYEQKDRLVRDGAIMDSLAVSHGWHIVDNGGAFERSRDAIRRIIGGEEDSE